MQQKVILLWDEDGFIQTALSKVLEQNGFEVLIAKREIQCFQYLSTRHVDLVLLNIKRNDLDGLMLTKRIKSQSKHRHTPVISITEFDNMLAKPISFSWGCDDYVTKPINKGKLFEKMDYLMDKYFY